MPASFEDRFLPDTGTTLSYIPTSAFEGLIEFFPDANLTLGFGYVVDCAHLAEDGYIDFGTKHFTIRVPYRDFIFRMPPEAENDYQATCLLGAVPTDDFFILGDTIMRAAYGTSPFLGGTWPFLVPGCQCCWARRSRA